MTAEQAEQVRRLATCRFQYVTATIAELQAMGELPGSVTFIMPCGTKVGRASAGYWANRSPGEYLRKGGTWGNGTFDGIMDSELPGYFEDLATLIDHLFVATHGGPEPAGATIE